MKNIYITFLLASIAILFQGCGKYTSDKLSLKKQPYTGNLRTDGYYIYYEEDSEYVAGLFLYRNGLSITVGGSFRDSEALEQFIGSSHFREKIKDQKGKVGLFTIQG